MTAAHFSITPPTATWVVLCVSSPDPPHFGVRGSLSVSYRESYPRHSPAYQGAVCGEVLDSDDTLFIVSHHLMLFRDPITLT